MDKSRRSVVRRNIEPKNKGKPLVTPLSPTAVYHYQDADQLQEVYDNKSEGFTYSRYGNPNATILAEKISWMEGATSGVVTASGMTALSSVFLALLKAGDCLAAATQLYGQTLKVTGQILPRLGMQTTYFDASDSSTFSDAITAEIRIVITEIVSNPMLRITDFKALIKAAKEVGAIVLVDNTFTTPNGFRPLDYGADLVMHSVTKMLSGHSDLNLGYIGGNDPEILKKIDDLISTLGLNASPHNCWLAERGLQTFDIRIKKAQENASELAKVLLNHPKVTVVHYPELPLHPDHKLAQELLKNGFGTMVSFVLKGDRDNLNLFLRAAENIPYGPTLGDVATMIIIPSISSHRELSKEQRLELGIEDNLIRVSVGIESFDLIKEDFIDALAAS